MPLLFLLTSDQFPGQFPSMLDAKGAADWLTAWQSLWHPALLRDADALPAVSNSQEHPQPECVYAKPGEPIAVSDAIAPEIVHAFAGVGLAYIVLESLFEAMSRENPLDKFALLAELRAAATQPNNDSSLRAVAQRLLAAREVLYPVTIHWLDVAFANQPLPSSLQHGSPLNLIATSADVEKLTKEQRDLIRQRLGEGTLELCGGLAAERADSLLPAESQLWNLRHGQARLEELLGRPATVFGRMTSAYHPYLPQILHQVNLSKLWLVPFDGARVPHHTVSSIRWPSPDGRRADAFTRTPQPADDPRTFFDLAYHLNHTIAHDNAAVFALVHGAAQAGPWYDDLLALSRLAPVLGTWSLVSDYLDQGFVGEYASAAEADDFDNFELEHLERDPVSAVVRHTHVRRRFDCAMTYAALLRSLGEPVDQQLLAQFDRFETEFETNIFSQPALSSSLPTPSVPHTGDTGPLPPPSGPLPPCGGGIGWGVEAREGSTPHPNPPPQGGRGPEIRGKEEEGAEKTSESFGIDNESRASEPVEFSALETTSAEALAARILRRATGGPGLLVLNPCSFARRASIERTDLPGPPPIGGPIKAVQQDGDLVRLVIDLPALGFAWIPKAVGESGTRKLIEDLTLRNEFFEADIDPDTGGLRGFHDKRARANRLGQQLVWQPGSTQRATSVRVTANGPALGEVTSDGEILSERGERLAAFTQRFRAWAGRPLLELRIELRPEKPPRGDPWHDYFGCRFAWREEAASIFGGMLGRAQYTAGERIITPDFLELRLADSSALIVTGGLPFHRRHGPRMLDTVLVRRGETATMFELAIGLNRPQPGHAAQGMISPVAAVAAEQGPSAVGPTGWLAHLDVPNVLVTSMRPVANAIFARLFEVGGHSGPASFRWARNPELAAIVDGSGGELASALVEGDAVSVDVGSLDLVNLQVNWKN
ncbi:MAG: hypothetical protein ACJ8C4_04915 [Gemmataceae bacterium]